MRSNRKTPLRLFTICCDCLIPIFENYGRGLSRDAIWEVNPLFESLGRYAVEELLARVVHDTNEKFDTKVVWKKEWELFLTTKIRVAIILWEKEALERLQRKCKNVQILNVVCLENFDVFLIEKIPKSVTYLIFYEEKKTMDEDLTSTARNWLPEAEELLKSLCLTRKAPLSTEPCNKLTQVHLGSAPATSADLQVILRNSPDLKVLRHYQMVKALYDLHSETWKKGEKLPAYKIKNLDIDFSHVIRCRMSPEWVLAPDALQLATLLCPQADQIHLRFDCSTPNDVLTPLLNLTKIKEFSAVCVTSGERTQLDFSDMAPVLEKHGPLGLAFLELKVIEEVDVHVIIEWCTKLDTLILSGCGYMTPPTCGSYDCASYKPGTFKRLRHLFFADGDDFSWDHGAPECFWKASLLPSGARHTVPLQGLFLEYPRIGDTLTAQIFHRGLEGADHKLPFPELKAASLCRYNELTVSDVASMCGLEATTSPPISFLRISECDLLDASQDKVLKNWFKLRCIDCQVQVDCNAEPKETKRPYTYQVHRPR